MITDAGPGFADHRKSGPAFQKWKGRDYVMRILIINPNSDENTDRLMAEKAKNLALPGVEVDVTHVTGRQVSRFL